MHIIQHKSSNQRSFQIMINTELKNIKFGNSSNYNNITFQLDHAKNIADESHSFIVSISHLENSISWPLISSYYDNNIFVYVLNGTTYTYTYTIPDGSYKYSDLLILFKSNIQLSVSYSKTSGKFTFSHSTYDFTISNQTTCYKELGFYNVDYYSSNKSLESYIPIDLSGTKTLYIRTNLVTDNIDSRSGKQGSYVLDNIPITVDNFFVLRYYNYHGFHTIIKDQTISEINVIIEDGKGQQIDIKNDFSLTLEFNIVMNDLPNIDKNNLKNFDIIQEEELQDESFFKKKKISKLYIMAEYSIQKIEPDLKTFLDILVRKELVDELRWDNIDDIARTINNEINIFIHNDDGSINNANTDIIRELFSKASKLNNYHDSCYSNREYNECKN